MSGSKLTGVMAAVVWTGLAVGMSQAQASPKDVYKRASPGVVLLLGSDDGKSGSGGTGSIITAEGKVITNAHVVINGEGRPYKQLYVFLKPNKITGDNRKDLVNRYKARVLKWSPAEELDLALLQIENPPANLPTIHFADPDGVEIGDPVVAIGHPEQAGIWTLTTGTISTVIANFSGVQGKHVFQTEASVNRGNSGGPLLDDNGNMIGINTAIARRGRDGVAITDVNFALKSSVAVSWLSGQGMGLAYAEPRKKEVVVAVAPQQVAPEDPPPAKTTSREPVKVREDQTPPATIVVAEKPPAQPEKIREEGKRIGTTKAPEKLEKGKPFDPKTAKEPVYHTKKRPYDLDDLRRRQMQELEDIMDDARGKIRSKRGGNGMGLW